MSSPVAPLLAGFTQSLTLSPSPNVSALAVVTGSGLFVFDDGTIIYGVSTEWQNPWTVTMNYQLNGWTVNDSNLYVQDGCVLVQYDIDALVPAQPSVPVAGFNFQTPASWSSPAPAAYGSYSGAALAFSGPVAWNTGANAMLYVLSGVGGSGWVYPVPANLVVDPTQVLSGPQVPDTPLALFGVTVDNQLLLQYLCNGQVIPVQTTSLPPTASSPVTPAVSAANWLTLGQAAIVRPGVQPQQSFTLAPAGQAQRVIVTVSSSPAPWQLLTYLDPGPPARTVVSFQMQGPGGFVGLQGQLSDPPGSPLAVSAPVVVFPEFGDPYFAVITRTSAGQYQLQIYKLAPLVPATAGPAWRLLGSQMAQIAPWLAAGGTSAATAPLVDPGTTLVCFAAALQALGVNAPAGAGVTAAATTTAEAILTIASGQGLPIAPMAADLFADGVSATRLYLILRGLNNTVGQAVQTLRTAGVPPSALAALLTAQGLGETEMVAGLAQGGCSALDVITAIVPALTVTSEYSGLDPMVFYECSGSEYRRMPLQPYQLTAAAKSLGAALSAAGYTALQIAGAILTMNWIPGEEQFPSAALIFAAYPGTPMYSIVATLESAGCDAFDAQAIAGMPGLWS